MSGSHGQLHSAYLLHSKIDITITQDIKDIEQSIGRGLRLPYGKRTGVAAVDRLNIVAHDRFQDH